MKKIFIFQLVTSALLLIGCTSLEEQSYFPANLLGIIFDDYNNPVEDARIEITGDISLTTDIDGRFILTDMTNEKHTIVISREGFETKEITFNFHDPKQILYIKLTSIEYLKKEVENKLFRKNYTEIPVLLARASRIDSNDPVLLYLSAIYYYKIDDNINAKLYIKKLVESGFDAQGISNLDSLVQDL